MHVGLWLQDKTCVSVSSGRSALARVGMIGIAVLMGAGITFADQTSGGINWLDPLPYKKPAFVSIAVPNEAAAPKYYVDLGGGSGSSCTQSAPCAITSVAGKPGTNGGPAYVYIKGTGGINLFNPSGSFYGAAGREIVVKPWPAGTTGCASGCTATVVNSGVNNLTGSNVHHWIFDGGPNMDIKFQTTTASDNRAMRVNSNDHTFYRVQGTCNNNGGGTILMTSEGQAANLKVINSEFYNCVSSSGAQTSAVYMGGSTCNDNASGFTNFVWQNNIVRTMGGEGIELNPRTQSSGATITGSAFHDIGKQTCAGGWDCRPAITVDGPSCGGRSSNVAINNNLIWDTGSAAIWTKGGSTGQSFDNNTIYDYGKGASSGVCQQGICGGTAATVRNNIIYSPNGSNPFDNTSFTTASNICASGESCGTSSKTWSASTVMATSASDANFMKPASGSVALAAGVNLFSAGLTVDYAGVARLISGLFDIGAFGGSGGLLTLRPPTNLRIVRP